MLSEFGDGSDDFIIGGFIKEDCIIRFFFDFSLGPFLN